MAISKILLDTNAYVAFKRGVPDAVEILNHISLIGISSIVLGELYSGFAVGAREETNVEELQHFLSSVRVRIFSVNEETARYYAHVYRQLRQQGRPIPTNDMWIAALALQHDLPVFSYDSHFQHVEGLLVGKSLADFIYGIPEEI